MPRRCSARSSAKSRRRCRRSRWTIRRRRCRRWRAGLTATRDADRSNSAPIRMPSHDAAGQGAAVRGRDQHCARHRLHGDRAASGSAGANRSVCGLRAAADDGAGRSRSGVRRASCGSSIAAPWTLTRFQRRRRRDMARRSSGIDRRRQRDRTPTLQVSRVTVPPTRRSPVRTSRAPRSPRADTRVERSSVAPSTRRRRRRSWRPRATTSSGVPVDIRVPVTRREAQLPYGYVMRELAVVPALAVTVSPRQAIVPLARCRGQERARAGRADQQRAAGSKGAAHAEAAGRMEGRAGVDPVHVRAAGREVAVSIRRRPSRRSRTATTASTRSRPPNGRTYREGYDVIEHRDLETRYLYRDAVEPRARRRRQDRAGAEGRLRDGRRRRRAGRASRSWACRCSC